MWYNFIDGRMLLVLVLIALVWASYFQSEEHANRKRGGYDEHNMCLTCGEHISDPHAIGCECSDE